MQVVLYFYNKLQSEGEKALDQERSICIVSIRLIGRDQLYYAKEPS